MVLVLNPGSYPLSCGNDRVMQKQELTEGLHKIEIKLSDGHNLKCSISVPQLVVGERVPLVLALHYGGDVVPYFGMTYLETLVEPAFKDLDAILIAPDCPGKNWSDQESEKDMIEMLHYILRTWPVDNTQIVVTGYSMGGMGAWFYGSKYPDIFCAAIPVAGMPTGNFEMQVPVYALHGQFDEIIDIQPTKEAIRKLRKNGLNAKLFIVEGLSHYQTNEYVTSLSKTMKWLKSVWKDRTEKD